MAYDVELAKRVTDILMVRDVRFKAKKMFGGVAYMVKNKMCVGVLRQDLMVRLDPDEYEKALSRIGAREMNFTGRPMKGFVFVDPAGTKTTTRLKYWIDLALVYNPKARASNKRPARSKRGGS